MKIDFELAKRLGEAAYSALVKQLEFESGGKTFQASGNQLIGMFLTANYVFIEHTINAMQKHSDASKQMIVQDFIEGLTFCFLRDRNELH